MNMIVNCDFCSKEIYKRPCDIKHSNNHFCSHKCHSDWDRKTGRCLGEKNPFYGKKHNKKTRQKMSEFRKNKSYEEIYGIETAKKLKELNSSRAKKIHTGKKVSKETRKKLREINLEKKSPFKGKTYEESFGIEKAELMDKYNVLSESKTGHVTVNCVGLAKLIMQEHELHFKTIVDELTGTREVYYYKEIDGYYKVGGDIIIKKLIQDYLTDFTTINRKREVLSFIEDSDASYRHELEPSPNLINLKNGVFDLDNYTLLPHSHEYGFINQLPIEYNSDATCPKILNFFSEIFPSRYKDYIKVVQEMFGFTFYRDYFLHVGFILYGRGRNGKGVTVNLLCNMLGFNNYSTRQLHDLLKYQFAKIDLYGKMANISGEISGRDIDDSQSASFKALTGHEPVTADKKHLGSINFINYAKLIFNANRIPKTHDTSFAFYQRWKIIVFSQTFPRGDKKTILNLDKKLSTPEELSGLFNWSLEGLKRIKKRSDFTDASHSTDEEELYELLSNPEVTFIHNFIEVDTEFKLSKDIVYERYYTWCEKNRFPITTKNMFTKILCEVIPETESRAFTTAEDKQGRLKTHSAYGNIKWVDNYIRFIKGKDDRQNTLEVDKNGEKKF